MREITEAQAQELADLLKMTIAVDENKDVSGFSMEPYRCIGGWMPSHDESLLDSWGCFPIHIISNRPWTEQIWRPRG